MNKQYLFVANWKMYLTYQESLDFAAQYYDDFLALARRTHIVLCPSAIALGPLGQMFKTTDIILGAQDCSDRHKGAVTGQISAESLKQVGCQYCIIGHSERRLYTHETIDLIAGKSVQLIKEHIVPIICIGETQDAHDAGKTLDMLEQQLSPVLAFMSSGQQVNKKLSVCIAYEPVWAIGTGVIPSRDHLELVYSWLALKTKRADRNVDWKLLFGGSVSSKTVGAVAQNGLIDGFLIGGASLDFQELKKIVDCTIAK